MNTGDLQYLFNRHFGNKLRDKSKFIEKETERILRRYDEAKSVNPEMKIDHSVTHSHASEDKFNVASHNEQEGRVYSELYKGAIKEKNTQTAEGFLSSSRAYHIKAAELYEEAGMGKAAEANYRLASKMTGELDKLKKINEEPLAERVHSNAIRLRSNRLEKTAAATSIIGIVSGIFFLSPNITGNIVGNLNQTSTNLIGAILLILGIIAGLFWFNKSQKKSNTSRKKKLKKKR